MHINIKDDGNSAPFIEAQEGILTFDAHGRPSVLSLAQLQALVSPGGTPQDMQVAWTPTNVKLGETMGFRTFNNALPLGIDTLTWNQVTMNEGFQIDTDSQLTSVSGPNMTSINLGDAASNFGIALYNCSKLTTVSFPLLTFIGQSGIDLETDILLTTINLPLLVTSRGGIFIDGCAALTTFSLPSYVPTNGNEQIITGAALNAASVNAFLHRLVLNAGYVSGSVDLSGGTSAAPTGVGLADKAALILRGCTVATN